MLSPGTELAGYRIEGFLGRGGMGVVYEATQLSIPRRVALKLLEGHDRERVERFRREALAQAGLEHPNVVPVYDAGTSEHGLYIAMRLIRGCTLKDRIRSGELTPRAAVALLAPIADALDRAHAEGLVHRDVKPQNILVDEQGHPYLADFGIVRSRAVTTETGAPAGTPAYMAPEQVLGGPATPAGDIYSLAVVLYECLTSAVPHAAEAPQAALYARLSGAPPRAISEMPRRLDAVLERGLARDPGRRPKTASALIRDAETALSPRHRRRVLLAGALVVGGCAAAVAVAALWPHAPNAKIEFVAVERGVTRSQAGASVDRFAMSASGGDTGALIRFRVVASGMTGRTLVVHCTLTDAHSGARIDSSDVTLNIDRDAEASPQSVWMPDHGASGRAYVSLELAEEVTIPFSSNPAPPEDTPEATLEDARSPSFALGPER